MLNLNTKIIFKQYAVLVYHQTYTLFALLNFTTLFTTLNTILMLLESSIHFNYNCIFYY